MASCGGPVQAKHRGSKSSAPCTCAHGATPRTWLTGAGVAAAFVLAACMAIKIGSPPRIDQLPTLTVGVSTAADVLVALGEPRGRGAAHFAIDPTPRTIWSYDYAEAEGPRMGLKMLLVFFNQDRYEGHLWFSSANLLERTE